MSIADQTNNVVATAIPTSHGEVWLLPAKSDDDLKLKPVKQKATGVSAVLNSFRYAWGEAGVVRGTLPLLQLNQKLGFDCPGCAWPDSDAKRPTFDFCENGAKAVAHEADSRRLTAEFFRAHSVSELSTHTDFWLEQQGRLTQPMVLRENATHYEPISWSDAYALIAKELNSLESADRAAFYTSGKATNEAAFSYQLFARQFGTNNLPDCSNMCHESSGRALSKMIGIGKGTVKLDDFEKAELVFVVGQNPGTNHPRQLAALQQAKRNGAKIIAVNPLPEAGLMGFMNPQEALGMLGFATELTDLFLQVKINGDIPLFKGIMKQMLEWEEADPGSVIDWDFVNEHAAGLDDLCADLRSADWDTLVTRSGVTRESMRQAADWVRASERIILCWCLGVTQHTNGTQNVCEMLNLLLLRGAIGKPGAGPCCVRGHSNVQGDRTMGVWEQPKDALLDRLQAVFEFDPPRKHGFDSQRAAIALHQGELDVFVSLGGNYLMALPDTRYAAEGLARTRLNVRIGTKLNRADLVAGGQSLILPCLGRSEQDVRPASDGTPANKQFTSTENSMGVIQSSQGKLPAASAELRNEVAIVCEMAAATLGDRANNPWQDWANDYDLIRDGIAAVIDGCENYNEKVRQPGGFYLPNAARERQFNTSTGKANFTINPIPPQTIQPGQFAMTTVRSHDQFNTTIYGNHDRYRGILNARRVVMMNGEDMNERGLRSRDPVAVTSHHDGATRTLQDFQVVEYPIPRQCVAMYFPEANPLIPMNATDASSNCPSFKHTVVTIEKC
ncbi:putative formate dehydrogenase [Novipirellula galeiformis]|uniref:Putative formate dehydrogenase n=1 Tax=Novipirellula galeiformis TaxID=2528004 RepID=A0A5C6CEJ1_9BACT|nr:FdhF/YdeP family oxidoreductase [Novipirellula galeiformis]TWU22435.1 putative formate dehydrogenase [Novipirellula galeiformis]